MNTLELIDSLCDVTAKLSDIVRKQQYIIAQHGIEVEDPAMKRAIEDAENEMGLIEMNLRGL